MPCSPQWRPRRGSARVVPRTGRRGGEVPLRSATESLRLRRSRPRRRGSEGTVSKPVGPYSPVVRAGDWLVISGQVGLRDGSLVSGGMQAELRQALSNVRALLDL